MKFSLCIETTFEDIDFYDRIKLAKDSGVDAVELWDSSAYDPKKIGSIAANNNIPVIACSLNKTWDNRLNFPYDYVKRNVEESIAYGKEFGCYTFIGLSGELECKVDSQKSILIENLKRISELCEKEGVVIVLEALNSLYDHKGYYLDSSYVGFEIVKSVNSPAIKLLYDCYHMQIMEGNMVNNITTNIDLIGHFHSAGVPGRHELQLGETNYPRVIKAAEDAGYKSYFGLEYWPSYENNQSLRDVLNYIKS